MRNLRSKPTSLLLCLSGNGAGNQVQFSKAEVQFSVSNPVLSGSVSHAIPITIKKQLSCVVLTICVDSGSHTGETHDNGSSVIICRKGDQSVEPASQQLPLELVQRDHLCLAPTCATETSVRAASPGCLTYGCTARRHNACHPQGCCDNC